MDVQEHEQVGRGTSATTPPRDGPHGCHLLKLAGYSLQANRKTKEGASNPDRNAQFEHINRQRRWLSEATAAGRVGGHEKEGIGRGIQERGQEWQPKGEPEKVNVHDFPDKKLGKAIPYGVYDLASNEGWVSVGIDHDTAQFAAASILRWWREMGSQRFPRATELMITADGGGSNSSRNRLWKVAAAGSGERTGPGACGVPFPAWNQQVEQDRTSPVLLHHQELARPSADQLRGDRESDREHHDEDRADGPCGLGYQRTMKRGSRSATRNWPQASK